MTLEANTFRLKKLPLCAFTAQLKMATIASALGGMRVLVIKLSPQRASNIHINSMEHAAMKCIKNDTTEQVVRVSDDEAAKTIKSSKGWHYTSKGAWKAAGRPK